MSEPFIWSNVFIIYRTISTLHRNDDLTLPILIFPLYQTLKNYKDRKYRTVESFLNITPNVILEKNYLMSTLCRHYSRRNISYSSYKNSSQKFIRCGLRTLLCSIIIEYPNNFLRGIYISIFVTLKMKQINTRNIS